MGREWGGKWDISDLSRSHSRRQVVEKRFKKVPERCETRSEARKPLFCSVSDDKMLQTDKKEQKIKSNLKKNPKKQQKVRQSLSLPKCSPGPDVDVTSTVVYFLASFSTQLVSPVFIMVRLVVVTQWHRKLITTSSGRCRSDCLTKPNKAPVKASDLNYSLLIAFRGREGLF